MSSGIVSVETVLTSPDRRSTRETDLASALTVQTAAGPTATAVGVSPTATWLTTLPFAGSMAAR
jgi:hypothetical protein